ncbi:unnamed protein product [Rotaria sp. Silwood2]|nr:unnamed protein product [Rotaria sp. Silwood2]
MGQTLMTELNVQTYQVATSNNSEQFHIHQNSNINEVAIINNHSSVSSNQILLNTYNEETVNQLHLSETITNMATSNIVAFERNHRLVSNNDGTDPYRGLKPIIEYADEPLLPLMEACNPLIGIVHDILTYAKRALKETSNKPSDQLTINESAAIRLYTFEWEEPHPSLYYLLNNELNTADHNELRPYNKFLKLFLTGLVKLPCVLPMTIWRGVLRNVSAEFLQGRLVTWWGFSSCTTSLRVLESEIYLGTTGERTLFSIETINGRSIRAHSRFTTEDEVLLLPGTYMEVKSQLSPAPDLQIFHLKQIQPPDILLAAPFEGNS